MKRQKMGKFKTAEGEVLADEDVEALADEAQRGYDLDRATKVTVGRPSLGLTGTSPRIQVRIDSELATALRSQARSENRSLSEIARSALQEYIDRAA